MYFVISYRKTRVAQGNPIVVRVGDTEIFTQHLFLKNITGSVYFGKKDFCGTRAPLVIHIDPEIVEKPQEILPQDQKKITERIRYRKLNPIVQRRRKEEWQ